MTLLTMQLICSGSKKWKNKKNRTKCTLINNIRCEKNECLTNTGMSKYTRHCCQLNSTETIKLMMSQRVVGEAFRRRLSVLIFLSMYLWWMLIEWMDTCWKWQWVKNTFVPVYLRISYLRWEIRNSVRFEQ